MDNYLLFGKDETTAAVSSALGFSRTLFQGFDFEVLTATSKKDLVQKTRIWRQKRIPVFFKPATEELLRFALERGSVSGVIGVEEIHLSDSVHFVRGGVDQVLCAIAARQGKVVAFSFASILNSPHRSRLLARMAFNLFLCKKYGVPVIFSNFSTESSEMRSIKDLQAFQRILTKGF